MNFAKRAFPILPAALAGLCLAAALLAGTDKPEAHVQLAQPRRPVAIAVGDGRIYVANHRSGTICVLDPSLSKVVNEIKVGESLSDLVILPDGQSLLTLDETKGDLIRLSLRGDVPTVSDRLHVGTSPVALYIARDGKICAISNLWAHRLTFVSLQSGLRIVKTIDLPFAPRKQWISPDGKSLLVADSFGGSLAIVDLPTRALRSIRTLPAHSIRGIATTPGGDEVMFGVLTLDSTLSTERDHVFWGQLMGNDLRTVRMDDLLAGAGAGKSIEHTRVFPIGEPNKGAGDIGDVAFAPDGKLLVALSGTDAVAVRRTPTDGFWRIDVGRRPTALALSPDGKQAYVANTLDDSVSVIDLATLEAIKTIQLGPQPTLTQADRGELLFYDARLSLDGWYSCNSCHVDGHTCGLLNDNHSDGSFDTPKRVLSLLGAADTGPWAWNGSNPTLEAQIRTSLENTMQAKPDTVTDETVSALAAYLRTLQPPPGVATARGEANASAIERGRRVFENLDCVHCHRPPAYTSAKTYDVGLHDEAGMKRFNPPSLRGVSQLPALFHDNRATSLRDALSRHQHPDGQTIPQKDLEDLLEFLRSI